jgi:PPOX class probable F420-dependent enzyme
VDCKQVFRFGLLHSSNDGAQRGYSFDIRAVLGLKAGSHPHLPRGTPLTSESIVPESQTKVIRDTGGCHASGGTRVRLRKSIVKLLTRERVCRVATAGGGGMAHVVPVCHVLSDGKVYFASGNNSQKVRNLKANPHLAVLVDLYSEDWAFLRGVLVQGTAKLLQRGPEFRKIRALLYQKYPQYPEDSALEEGDDIIVEMTPTRVSSWGLEE